MLRASSAVRFQGVDHGKVLQSSGASFLSVHWEPDTANCQICSTQFTLTRRRHHCRKCGRCCCDDCSRNRIVLDGCSEPQRVCGICVQPLGGIQDGSGLSGGGNGSSWDQLGTNEQMSGEDRASMEADVKRLKEEKEHLQQQKLLLKDKIVTCREAIVCAVGSVDNIYDLEDRRESLTQEKSILRASTSSGPIGGDADSHVLCDDDCEVIEQQMQLQVDLEGAKADAMQKKKALEVLLIESDDEQVQETADSSGLGMRHDCYASQSAAEGDGSDSELAEPESDSDEELTYENTKEVACKECDCMIRVHKKAPNTQGFHCLNCSHKIRLERLRERRALARETKGASEARPTVRDEQHLELELRILQELTEERKDHQATKRKLEEVQGENRELQGENRKLRRLSGLSETAVVSHTYASPFPQENASLCSSSSHGCVLPA